MLDLSMNQASGLQGLSPAVQGQMIALVSHGDEHGELPLLWKLCATLVALGYPTTVLDATTAETATDPGLAQLLDSGHWLSGPVASDPAWTVLPAAVGMQELCASATRAEFSMGRLGSLFGREGVVILYSKPEWIATLLGESGIEPALALSSAKNSLLTSYLALKRLLIDGALEPTIVHVSEGKSSMLDMKQSPIAMNLTECARTFLGFDAKPLTVSLAEPDGARDGAMRHLVLHMLESAVPLGQWPENFSFQPSAAVMRNQ